MSAPRHLLSVWPQVRERLARARRRALLTDYDGTLTRIRQRPEQATLAPSVRALLRDIARHDLVGVISGRRLSEVRNLVRLPRIWTAGVHGYYLRDPGGRHFCLLTPEEEFRMARIGHRLATELRGVPGVWVEQKGAVLAVHYRQAARRARSAARRLVARVARMEKNTELLSGKKVWEIVPRPRSGQHPVSKWTAVQFILQCERRGHAAALAVYLGDDTTDESVFRKLDGISVAVGKRRATHADYFLNSPSEVREFLAKWKESRKWFEHRKRFNSSPRRI